jgi:hypothetical protein
MPLTRGPGLVVRQTAAHQVQEDEQQDGDKARNTMTAPNQPTEEVMCVVNVNLPQTGTHRHDWKLRRCLRPGGTRGAAAISSDIVADAGRFVTFEFARPFFVSPWSSRDQPSRMNLVATKSPSVSRLKRIHVRFVHFYQVGR